MGSEAGGMGWEVLPKGVEQETKGMRSLVFYCVEVGQPLWVSEQSSGGTLAIFFLSPRMWEDF